MRVGYLNISDATTKCPESLTLYDASGKKLCGPTNTDSIKCDSLTFHTHHIPYNFVCSKAVGYGYYHHGSGSPCLRRLHLILKFAGVSHIGLPVTELALSNLKFMSFDFTIYCLSCLVCSGLHDCIVAFAFCNLYSFEV